MRTVLQEKRRTTCPRQRADRAGGFTLIEALLAGMILAIGAAALAAGVSRNLQALTVARDYQQAACLLDEIMTRIDMVGPYRILVQGPRSGRFEPPHDAFEWEAVVASLSLPDLYEITVTITWRDGASRRSISGCTRLNDAANSHSAALIWEDI